MVSQSLLVNQYGHLVIGIKEIKERPHKLSKWHKELVERHQRVRRCSMKLVTLASGKRVNDRDDMEVLHIKYHRGKQNRIK